MEPVINQESEALSLDELYRYLEDIRDQPRWRDEADRAADYYDGNQTSADTLAALEKKGMGPLTKNIIASIINVVLGMEVQTRSDWRVTGDDDESQEVAEALSAKLHEVERETHADSACAEAFADQVKTGLGWVEVGRNMNPFLYPYRVNKVHRREIWWDWRDMSPNLSSARYVVRKRWFDVDQAIAFFPQHKELLEAATSGDPFRYPLQNTVRRPELLQDLSLSDRLDIEMLEEWRSTGRKRVCLYEVWYRRWVRGHILRLGDETMEFDPENPVHRALVSQGVATPEPAIYDKLRMSIWAGPHRLHDCGCDRDALPYVPFWGYREDRTGIPYGLIRGMMWQQDEVNARRRKLMWLLSARRVLMDSDAIDRSANDLLTVLNELSRPDAVIQLNPHRTNPAAFQVDDNMNAVFKLHELVKEAEESVQQVAGVFNSMLGRSDTAKSGVAIDALVTQGVTVLAKINDNYRYARTAVGEKLLDLIRQDMIGTQITVAVADRDQRKVIVLNKILQDPAGGPPRIVNNVATAKTRLALDDVPSSPAYRQQQQVMLAEVMKGMPPQLQAAIAPFWLEASNVAKRREMADAIRRVLGMQAEPRTPEEAQALMQQQQLAQMQTEIGLQSALLDLEEKKARIEKLRSDTTEAQRFRDDLVKIRTKAAERENQLLGELSAAVSALKSRNAG